MCMLTLSMKRKPLYLKKTNFTYQLKVYNSDLCAKDSDGDGRSNGEEMGDPECVWQQGQTPSTAPIGHPGITL